MKRFIITLILLLIIPIFTYADDYENYLESFDTSAFELLEEDTKSFLEDSGIDGFSIDSLSSFSLSDVSAFISDRITDSLEAPLRFLLIIIAVSVLTAIIKSADSNRYSEFYAYASTLIITVILCTYITDCINITYSTIKICSDFAYAFFPAFCIIVGVSGGTLTSLSTNTLLLGMAQFINFFCSNFVVPILNCVLAFGICSAINEEVKADKISELIKRFLITGLSLISSAFITVLSIRTAVASKADSLGIRSLRFAINTVVPVIGPSVSEGLTSIQMYSGLIKTSVGVVGIVSVIITFLPALIQIILWRLALMLCGLVTDVFEIITISNIIKAFRDVLRICEVLIILTMLTTVISIGILVASRTVS